MPTYKATIAEIGGDEGELYFDIGQDSDFGDDLTTFIIRELSPVLRKNDGIRMTTVSQLHAGVNAVHVRYQKVAD